MSVKVSVAREGLPFIVVPAVLGAGLVIAGRRALALPFAAASLVSLGFFRDPEREVPSVPGGVLSPADGRVLSVDAVEDRFVGPAVRVAIFLSPLDVHVNRAPITGRIVEYRYNPGRKIAAFAEKSSLENEQNLVVIEDGRGGTVALKQIAGLLARRIVFDKKEGDEVVRGERIGMIKFGSRVDVFFSPATTIKVQMREKVKVGLTVIAEIEERA